MYVVGNWKMHGSQALIHQFLPKLCEQLSGDVKVGLCVPFPYLSACAEMLADNVKLGAQDVSEHQSGAYTGEVSASMLAENGANLAIVGHSERREYHGESNALVGRKAAAALAAGITPIVCVGETLAQRKSGRAEAVVLEQLDAVLAEFEFSGADEWLLAYEPVWAIGTGEVATVAEAQAMHATLRERLARHSEAAKGVSILYGGSVKPDNAAALFAAEDIDGALVGGAALKVNDFLAICTAAAGE